jgi:ribosome biogenesis protein SSF1/2
VNFKEDASNRKVKLSHYASSLTGSLGITHILALSQNASKITLRICRSPSGPTLSFRVKRFTLGRQIRSVQRRPYDSIKAYDSPPIVVTNNFGDVSAAPHVKLMRITFQNMFPPINVSTVKLGECRRVVLFNFIRRDAASASASGNNDNNNNNTDDDDLEDEEVEVRHYAIRTKPVGVDRKVRRLIEAKIPNLSKLNDIADYITNDHSGGGGGVAGSGNMSTGDISDSEAEDETSHVVLPVSKTKGGKKNSTISSNPNNNKSALKLIELGPRLRLKLYKVERGLSSGDVMYHAYVHKSPTEIAELKARKDAEVTLKKRRREEQEANVARKKRAKEEKKEARELRRKEREERAMAELRGEGTGGGKGELDDDTDDESEDDDDDDDVNEENDSDEDVNDGHEVINSEDGEEEGSLGDEFDRSEDEGDSSGDDEDEV